MDTNPENHILCTPTVGIMKSFNSYLLSDRNLCREHAAEDGSPYTASNQGERHHGY
jgi:hypothetical protein